jgi:hypothetical protein
MGHITIDGIEIFQSIKEWVNHYEPGSKTPELDETLRHTYERKASEGLADTKFLDTRQLAEEVGMTADYKYIAKVCSKLVHPTAWSVLSKSSGTEEAQFRHMLFHIGARFGLDAFNTQLAAASATS